MNIIGFIGHTLDILGLFRQKVSLHKVKSTLWREGICKGMKAWPRGQKSIASLRPVFWCASNRKEQDVFGGSTGEAANFEHESKTARYGESENEWCISPSNWIRGIDDYQLQFSDLFLLRLQPKRIIEICAWPASIWHCGVACSRSQAQQDAQDASAGDERGGPKRNSVIASTKL